MNDLSVSSFVDVLHSDGPAPELRDRLELYAFLVGRWDTKIHTYQEDGASRTGWGEIHAGWVLEGRAIQDVWMTPPRSERPRGGPPSTPVTGAWYGTTLRSYDPGIDGWRILWSDPATPFYAQQIGRAEGSDIVQLGQGLRWRFTEIEPDSFRWLGEISEAEGRNWRLQVEVIAKRAASSSA